LWRLNAWKFSFSVTARNESRNEGRTNFSIQIPTSEACTEGRSTNIKLKINPGQFGSSAGRKLLVTDSFLRKTTTTISRSVDCYVNGTLNDYAVYDDDLGFVQEFRLEQSALGDDDKSSEQDPDAHSKPSKIF
jgi:hypothetical protein